MTHVFGAFSFSFISHRRQDMDGLSHRNVESTISYELPYNESSRRITLCRPSTLDRNHQEEGEAVDIPPGAVLIICTTGQLLGTRGISSYSKRYSARTLTTRATDT